MQNHQLAVVLGVAFMTGAADARMPYPLINQTIPGYQSAGTLPQRLDVMVRGVLDGDTITVDAFSNSVRIASIDAPETEKRGKPGQAFAQAAKAHLIFLIGPTPRRAELQCYETDRHQRPVCDVMVQGRDVGHEMVADGYSLANTAAQGRYLFAPHLLAAQKQAQRHGLGMWGGKTPPIEPWKWREDCWVRGSCQPQPQGGF